MNKSEWTKTCWFRKPRFNYEGTEGDEGWGSCNEVCKVNTKRVQDDNWVQISYLQCNERIAIGRWTRSSLVSRTDVVFHFRFQNSSNAGTLLYVLVKELKRENLKNEIVHFEFHKSPKNASRYFMYVNLLFHFLDIETSILTQVWKSMAGMNNKWMNEWMNQWMNGWNEQWMKSEWNRKPYLLQRPTVKRKWKDCFSIMKLIWNEVHRFCILWPGSTSTLQYDLSY